jgi:hypothetical protein
VYRLGSSILALQVQDVAPLAGSGGGILKILADASPLTLAVLVILITFSIVSWAIILFKAVLVPSRRSADGDVPRGVSSKPEVL